MSNNALRLDTMAGDTWNNVAEEALSKSKGSGRLVVFEFNQVDCYINPKTELELLWRDYSNAHLMEWKEVGPNCLSQYDNETQKELERRVKERAQRQAESQKKYEDKCKRERATFKEKTGGVDIDLIKPDEWKKCKESNSDPYGACAVEYAESWAKLMQVEISKGNQLKDIAESTSHELGYLGITGFMYGCAVGILSQVWKHGEELRKWHNGEYNHDGDGIVNPAILKVS